MSPSFTLFVLSVAFFLSFSLISVAVDFQVLSMDGSPTACTTTHTLPDFAEDYQTKYFSRPALTNSSVAASLQVNGALQGMTRSRDFSDASANNRGDGILTDFQTGISYLLFNNANGGQPVTGTLTANITDLVKLDQTTGEPDYSSPLALSSWIAPTPGSSLGVMLLSGYGEGMIVWQNFAGTPLILQRIVFSTGDVRQFFSTTISGFGLVEKVGPFFSYGILENVYENYNLLSCQNDPSAPFLRLGLTYTSTFTTITGIGSTCSMLSLALSSSSHPTDQLYFMSEDLSGLQEVKLALVACNLILPSNKTNNYFFLESFSPGSCRNTETYNHILEEPKIFASNTTLFVLGRYNLLILDFTPVPRTPALSLSSIAVVTDYSTGNSYCFGPLAGVCSATLPTTFYYITQLDSVTGQPNEVSTLLSLPIPVPGLAVSQYNIIGSGFGEAYIWINGSLYRNTFSTATMFLGTASFSPVSTLMDIFSSCPGIFFMNGVLHTDLGVVKILLPFALNGDIVAWVPSTSTVEISFSFPAGALPGICGLSLSPTRDAWTFLLSGQSSVLLNAPQYPTLVYCSASTTAIPFQVLGLSLTTTDCVQLSTRLSTGPYSLFTPWVATGTVFAYGTTGLGRYQATIPGGIIPLTGDVLGVAYMVTDFSTNRHYVFRNASGDYIQVTSASAATSIVEIDPATRLALGSLTLTTPFTITGDCNSGIGELVVLSGYGEVGFLIGSNLYTIDPTSGGVVVTLISALPSLSCCGNTPPSGILEIVGSDRTFISSSYTNPTMSIQRFSLPSIIPLNIWNYQSVFGPICGFTVSINPPEWWFISLANSGDSNFQLGGGTSTNRLLGRCGASFLSPISISPSVTLSSSRSVSLSTTPTSSTSSSVSLSVTPTSSTSSSLSLSATPSRSISISITPLLPSVSSSFSSTPSISTSRYTSSSPSRSISTQVPSPSTVSASITMSRNGASSLPPLTSTSRSRTPDSTPTPTRTPTQTPTTPIDVGAGLECKKDDVICPDLSCKEDYSDCDGIDGRNNDDEDEGVDDIDYTFTEPNRTVVIGVSSQNNTQFIGQITFPPGTIPAGWTVKIRDANNDKNKLSEDKNNCDKDRKEQEAASRPFSVRVFDSKGQERKIEGLEDYILIQIWAQLERKDLDKTCIGFTELLLPGWKCLQQLKTHSSKDEDSFFLTTETDHLTSFAVLLQTTDPCSSKLDYIIAVSICLGVAICLAATLVVLAYTANPFQEFLLGTESMRIYQLRILAQRERPSVAV